MMAMSFVRILLYYGAGDHRPALPRTTTIGWGRARGERSVAGRARRRASRGEGRRRAGRPQYRRPTARGASRVSANAPYRNGTNLRWTIFSPKSRKSPKRSLFLHLYCQISTPASESHSTPRYFRILILKHLASFFFA